MSAPPGADPDRVRGGDGRPSRAPAWGLGAVIAVAVPLLARAGRPAHKPVVTAATLPATVQAPSQDVVTGALGSLGLPGIDRWLRDGHQLVFPSPVREDGLGWRAEVGLPYGGDCGDGDQAARAAGLRAAPPARCEPVTSQHAGWLELGGRPCGRGQVEVGPVAAAARRAGRHLPAHPVRHRCARPDRQGPARLPQLADRRDTAPGQNRGCARPGLRCSTGPAGRNVGARAEGLGGPGSAGACRAHRLVSGVDDESIGYAPRRCACCAKRSCAAPNGSRPWTGNCTLISA
jgi:S-DNA-T family DNA segregation ATPase FtsK/SpoIIIE